jgi:trehalose-phosphatase
MPLTSSTILERLLAAHQRGERLVLVFDYDGTLTPLVAHPRLAQLDPALRDVLARLATIPRVTVGVVSGRGLDDLIGMVGLEGLSYGGSTGLELELAGERQIPAEALDHRALLDSLSAAFEQRLVDTGAWVEKKPFGFTVHYRQMAIHHLESLLIQTFSLLRPHLASLRVLNGPMALEVVPAIERDKGTALRAIVAHGGGEPATVLYAGDAANDAPALAAATALGGIALGIGAEPPAEAADRLPDPAALTELLAALTDELTTVRLRV